MTDTTGPNVYCDSRPRARTASPHTMWPWTWLDLRVSRLLFPLLFFFYTVFLILLPTGNVFGVNVKAIAFLLLLPVSLYQFVSSRRVTYISISRLLLPPLLLSVWLLLSLFKGRTGASPFLQYKDVIVTIAGCWFVSLYVDDESNPIRYVRLVIICVSIISFLKLVLLAYAYANSIPISEVIMRISTFFGIILMTADFGSSGELGGRFQFVSDVLIPSCIFGLFALRHQLRFSSIQSIVLSYLLLASAMFSFSRYLWAYCAVAVCLGVILAKKRSFLVLYVIVAIAISMLRFEYIQGLVVLRFSDAVAGLSDVERTAQGPALLRLFVDAPIMGHGMGSYSHEIIRNDDLPYSYENQLLALASQVGLVGLLLLLGIVVRYFRALLIAHHKDRLYQSAVIVLVIVFVSGGMFNPCLISSTASVSFGTLMALSKVDRGRVQES